MDILLFSADHDKGDYLHWFVGFELLKPEWLDNG